MSQPATQIASAEPFNPIVTKFEYPWPKGITPLERIILSANGDLQRMLSAFFALPITIDLIYSQILTPNRPSSSASPSTPIVQKRQVHLLCEGRTVCVATSSVTITSPECARLFLEEKYAIGQLFRTLGTAPKFALLKIGTGEGNSDGFKGAQKNEQGHSTKLWRKYTLDVDGVACEITEVFPDRELFIHPEEWLSKHPVQHSSRRSSQAQRFLDSSEGPLGS